MRDEARQAHSLLQQQPLGLRLLHPQSPHEPFAASPARNYPSSSYPSPGFVPFLWETSPGLPKPYPGGSSDEFASPACLPPPPGLHSTGGFAHYRPRLPPVSARHSFSAKVRMIMRRQRASSLDAEGLGSQLRSLEFSDLADRNDKMRASKPVSYGVILGLEKDLAVAGRSRSDRYIGFEQGCPPRRRQVGTNFSPQRKHALSAVDSASSAVAVSGGLCSNLPESLTYQQSDNSCFDSILSSHEELRASEVNPKMSNQNNSKCRINPASHSSTCSALAKNDTSALDQKFACHEGVFPDEGRNTYHTKVRGSAAFKVHLPVELRVRSKSIRSFISMEDEEFTRRQVSKAAGQPLNKHKKSTSHDTILSAFNIIQEKQSREVRLHGASTQLLQIKKMKRPTSKSKLPYMPKLCSTSQACAVAPSKSMSRTGIKADYVL